MNFIIIPPFRLRLIAGILFAALSAESACAGTVAEIEADMRLSGWINAEHVGLQQDLLMSPKRAHGERPYLPGLVWMVPEEARVQERVKSSLLDQIGGAAPGVMRADVESLARFVASFPATGRVVVEKTDARWLEVNPQQDPLLKKGQHILIPSRPASVTLVKPDGSTCQVTHRAGLYAIDYADQCNAHPQQAWVVQPDGLVRRSGVALWNESEQDTPAPGAWIVVDDPDIPWPDEILSQVARLLATQGVAVDRVGTMPSPQLDDGIFNTKPRDNALTANDWGMIGLLQTPTARMQSAGNAAMNVTQVQPYTRITGSLQPVDWFELAVRWTDISNRLYGPANFSGNQSYKDKSVDFKLKLSDETALFPQLSVGLIDLGGTGLFSSEYLVSSKRTGNFDWSLGLAWGYLGSRGNLGNPLSALSPKFSVRPAANAVAGQVNGSSMFRGQTALFGGVQYQTPYEPLLLKLEYDGNNYQREPMNNPQPQSSPFNVGAVYRFNRGLDFAVSLERGNTLGMGFNFHGDLSKFTVPKLNDPESEPVSALYPDREPDWDKVASLLEEKTSWHVLQIGRAGSEVIVRFQDADAVNWNGYVDRIVSVLHRYVPNKNILVFRIQSTEYGLGMHEFQIDRHAWVEAKTGFVPVQHKRDGIFERPAVDGFDYPQSEILAEKPLERFTGNTGLYLDHSFGGPEGLLYKLGVAARGNYYFEPGTWWTSSLQYGLIDNYNRFVYAASNSTLPRVRTQIERYINTSPVTMPMFQFTHVDKLGSDNFVSVYGGMLESMYGGIGGEWLYRPWNSPVALGVDLNAVKQRGFRQDFTFQKYNVATGHASLYWDTGFEDINATVHAGKYLAGDVGATLDLSRSFRNGVKMGAYATKTNVSAAQFGEGSFDKGVYVDIPFDAILTRSSTNIATLQWHPLLRDGGAMLNREFPLYQLTKTQRGDLLGLSSWSDERRTEFGDAPDNFAGLPPGRSVFAAAQRDLVNAGRLTMTSGFWDSMLWMGGITMASSLLDKPVDKVAVRYGARPSAVSAESFGNALPFIALGASGAAFLGKDPDSKLATTAYDSLAAGGIGLVSTLGLKYIIGRDRPLANRGASSFNFMSANNGNASMPSGHTTIMWAAVTPYAKAYDAPWLYGVAALTNLARIGGRNHWFSDTVAGSMFGYAIGEFIYQSHKETETHGMQWQISPNGVSAYWKMD